MHNENRTSMKFMYKVSVQHLNNELLFQWYQFDLYDEMMTSNLLENQDNVLDNLISNDYFLTGNLYQ